MLKTSYLVATALLFGAGVLSAAERVEKYEWPVGDHPIIKVETFRGEIRVVPSESGKVSFALKASAGGPNAEGWLEQISVSTQPFGAGMVVSVKRQGLGLELTPERQPRRDIELVLEVPMVCSLDLKSELGRIEVADGIQGHLRARSSRGDVFFGHVGGSVKIETGSGVINVERVEGDLLAQNAFGDIHVGTVKGKADLTAEHGSIEILSSLGGMMAKAVKGNVQAGISRFVADDTSIHAIAGDVLVRVDPASSLTVDARSSWGKVRSSLDVDASGKKARRSRLSGILNGGGPLLALKASGGNVHIQPEPIHVF
ncbi:MAG: hypothetical protein SynsKO_02820 [Synoicihabitans sp.]